METNNNGGGVQAVLYDKEVVTELSGEFTLPDYQPEIRRLLRIRPCVLPAARYIGSGNVEFTGNIDYYVLYSGSDGGMYCAPLTSEYSVSVPVDPDTVMNSGDMICSISSRADSVSGRVTAPRKLTVRCRLHSDVRMYGDTDITAETGGNPEDCETLNGEVQCARTYCTVADTLRIDDEIIRDRRNGDIRIICAEGEVMISEASAGSDAVNCRGEATLKIMTTYEGSEDTVPEYITRKLPFSQIIPLEGVTTNCECCAHGCCSEISVEVTEAGMNVSIGVITEVRAQRNMNVRYIKDMYSTKEELKCEYNDFSFPIAGKCVNGNFTLSDSKLLSETEIAPGTRVADVCGTAHASEINRERGRYVVSGDAKFNLLLLSPDNELLTSEIVFPFRYETECGNEIIDSFDANLNILSCRARIDGERIGIDAETAVCLSMYGKNKFTALTRATPTGITGSNRGEYIICYPSPEDTLWSVAKRYHTHLSDISAGNKLPPRDTADSVASLKDVHYLII